MLRSMVLPFCLAVALGTPAAHVQAASGMKLAAADVATPPAPQPPAGDDPSAQETKPLLVGAWSFSKVTDESLMRSAETVERNRKDSRLSVALPDARTCGPATDDEAVSLSFGSERREAFFQPKGPAGSQRVKAWLFFGLHGVYAAAGRAVLLQMSENDGGLYFSVPLKAMQVNGLLALCPTDVKGKPTKDCHEYSLDGFSKAYAFVCGRK